MKIAYADPPYVGCGHRYPEKAEVDHAVLIKRLQDEYPEGWALSCHTPSLKYLLGMRPDDIRVAAWVKPFCVFKPGVNPAYAWEPILWRGGREKRDRSEPTVRDWVSHNITMKKGLTGAKPKKFCEWLCDLMGLLAGDKVVDLFPGTGILGEVARERGIQCIESREVAKVIA